MIGKEATQLHQRRLRAEAGRNMCYATREGGRTFD